MASRVRKHRISEETGWLLIEDAEDKLRAWLCWELDEWSLHELASYAHLRWAIEQFQKMPSKYRDSISSKVAHGRDGITTVV